MAAGAAGSISIPGLVGISGPLTDQPSALDDDYIIGTPAELADALRDLALARCGASLDVEKQSVGGTATFDFTRHRRRRCRRPLPATPRRPTPRPTALRVHRPPVRDQVRPGDARAGWTLTNIACTANSAVITIGTGSGAGFAQGATAGFDPGDTTVRAVIDASDTPTCTFTNSQASLEIEKQRWAAPRPSLTPAPVPACRPLHPDTTAANPTTNAPFTFTAPQFGTKDVRKRPCPRLDADEHRLHRERRRHHHRHRHRRRLRVARRRGLQRRRHHGPGGHRRRGHPDLHVHEQRRCLARRREAERGRHRDLRLRRRRCRPAGDLHPGYRRCQPDGQRAVHVRGRPVRDQGRPGDAPNPASRSRTSCALPTAP